MLTHLWKLTHEYRKTAGGLSPISKGILAQSFSCKKLSNQKHTANTVRNTGRTTLCWIRGKVKEFLFIKLTSYLSLPFRNLSQQGKFYYLRKTLKSRRRFPFWGEIKPPTPVLLTFHFSAELKALVLCNLFKVFRLAITFAREDEENMTIVLFSLLSPKANCPSKCDGKSFKLE